MPAPAGSTSALITAVSHVLTVPRLVDTLNHHRFRRDHTESSNTAWVNREITNPAEPALGRFDRNETSCARRDRLADKNHHISTLEISNSRGAFPGINTKPDVLAPDHRGGGNTICPEILRTGALKRSQGQREGGSHKATAIHSILLGSR
jgi:hypothetical protein